MFAILGILLAAVFLRIYLTIRDSVPFALDMGRDLLWSKDISFYGIQTLLGPWASIWGVYFPPFWFYFLSIPLRISGGHPLSAVSVTAATIITTGLLAFLLFKKDLSKFYALSLSIFILFSATLTNISTFAFHANVLPILTLSFIYLIYLAKIKNPQFFAAAAFVIGLMYSADPAPAVVMTLVAATLFIYFKFYKSKNLKKLAFTSAIAYAIPLSPNILFELRNNFVQTKALIAYFKGDNPSLAGQLPLFERVANRVDLFFEFTKASFAGNNALLTFLILSLLVFGMINFFKKKKQSFSAHLNENLDILLKINLLTIIVSFLVLTLLITVEIKIWYLYGLSIPIAFLIATAIYAIKNKILSLLFITIFVTTNILPFFKDERIRLAKQDPAQLSNQMKAVNLIYQDATNTDFSVYVFTPAIYDYPYQYLFWWQGQAHGRGLPLDFAYLPNQPDYIKNKNIYAPNAQISENLYLIIENALENEFYTKNDWLKNFQDFKLVWEEDINSAITVQKRISQHR